ncbi:hypothetical protein [Bacillus sp. CECT 9360]|uniref:hypothetical protein n=1 Tax=Bacillus sp. CECT 9360 TaxID=2845821 RepID=UPI001E3FF20C|nr:hypothetical protein [Bacillus sp. CECT 9360]CAH0345727.1 hypothetical protein BCI9360_02025 [Bacillus sp. CECT 9360]
MTDLESFMEMGGEQFEVYRNDIKIEEVEGVPNREKETNRAYIGFYPNTDIEVGDRLVGKISKNKYYIDDKKSQVIQGSVFQLKGYYLTERELEKMEKEKKTEQTIIYNLYGANARINNNSTDHSINIVDMSPDDLFDELRKSLKENINDEQEKAQLRELVNGLEGTKNTRKLMNYTPSLSLALQTI